MPNALIVFAAKYLFLAVPLLVIYAGLRAAPEQRKTLLVRGVIVLVVSIILAKGGGAMFNEPRPFVVRHVAPLIPHEPDNGFPSDHTLLTMACALLIAPFAPPAALAAAIIALVVGAARIAAGLHSPLDIAASLGFAALANLIALGLTSLGPARRRRADEV